VADAKMSSITWIIIILIIVSILVTATEVTLRFGILEKSKTNTGARSNEVAALYLDDRSKVVGREDDLEVAGRTNISIEKLQRWSQILTKRQREAVCGSSIIGETFAEEV
jgi:flagellar basal body-associated protein FliL